MTTTAENHQGQDPKNLHGFRVTVYAAFVSQPSIALGVWQGSAVSAQAAQQMASDALWDVKLTPLADAGHCAVQCHTESEPLPPPTNGVFARYGWNWFRVGVSAHSEDQAVAQLGTWEGAANNRGEAHRSAVEALWDDRLDDASCRVQYETERLENPPEKFTLSRCVERSAGARNRGG